MNQKLQHQEQTKLDHCTLYHDLSTMLTVMAIDVRQTEMTLPAKAR